MKNNEAKNEKLKTKNHNSKFKILSFKFWFCALLFTLFAIYFATASFASVSNFELKGTIFTPSLKPIAILKDLATGKVGMYEAGETIGTVKILDVKRGEVVLQEGAARYTVELPGGGVSQPKTEDITLAIAQEGGTFYISRTEVDNIILNAHKIMRNVKVMPYFEKGKPQGIRLSSIKEGSIFEKAGVKQDDVVKKVNGFTLNSPFQVFNAYKKLRNEKTFKVEVLRDNKLVALNYAVQ